MIKDSKYFDNSVYDTYLNNKDYVNAANYLKGFQWKDKRKQQIIDNTIKTFETSGRVSQALYNKANEKERQAMSFLSGFDSGSTLPTQKDTKGNYVNYYTRMYTKGVNKLGGDNSTNLLIKFNPRVEKRYANIGITHLLPFGDKIADLLSADQDMGVDGFTLFSKQIGMDQKTLQRYGATFIKDDDGNIIMNVAKNNKILPRIIQALYHTTSNYSVDKPNIPMYEGTSGTRRFEITGTSGDSKSIENSMRRFADADKEHISHNLSLVESGLELKGLNDLISDANDKRDNLLKTNEHSYSTKAIVANYLGQDDLRAKQANDATLIKSVKDGYDRVLMGSSFADMKVYSNVENPRAAKAESDDPGTLKYEDDVSKRVAIHNLITANINDVSYAAAMVGDKTGTMITIPEKRDKDSNKVIVPAKQIFVEGLFNSQAEETFNADSKLRATKDFATMQTYDYDYDIVDQKAKGKKGRLFGADDNGAWYDNGVDQPYRVDKLQAIDLINMQHIVDDGATMLARSFSNPDGSMRNNVRFKEQLDNYTKAAVSELEPEAFKRVAEGYQRGGGKALDAQGQIDYEYYKKRQAELANFIMNGVVEQMQ